MPREGEKTRDGQRKIDGAANAAHRDRLEACVCDKLEACSNAQLSTKILYCKPEWKAVRPHT